MTIRHKIADWISGGELTRLRRNQDPVTCILENGELRFTNRRKYALRQIIAQETPRANATVRRMAAIAKEALE